MTTPDTEVTQRLQAITEQLRILQSEKQAIEEQYPEVVGVWPQRLILHLHKAGFAASIAEFLTSVCGFTEGTHEYQRAARVAGNVTLHYDFFADGTFQLITADDESISQEVE